MFDLAALRARAGATKPAARSKGTESLAEQTFAGVGSPPRSGSLASRRDGAVCNYPKGIDILQSRWKSALTQYLTYKYIVTVLFYDVALMHFI